MKLDLALGSFQLTIVEPRLEAPKVESCFSPASPGGFSLGFVAAGVCSGLRLEQQELTLWPLGARVVGSK